MEELRKQTTELQSEVSAATAKLKIAELASKLEGLQQQSQSTDFWQDSTAAQDVMKQIARLEAQVQPWQGLSITLRDTLELLELNDSSVEAELRQQIAMAQEAYATLKAALKFNGPYDDHDAILTLSAGAGGTDAQD